MEEDIEKMEVCLLTPAEASALVEKAPEGVIFALYVRMEIPMDNGNNTTLTWVNLTRQAALGFLARCLTEPDKARGAKIRITISTYFSNKTAYWIG